MLLACVATAAHAQGLCITCHSAEVTSWASSHHAAAMQVPSERTVLGDFGGIHFGTTAHGARFLRDGPRYVIETQNASGQLQKFDVAYTFGIDPLQQYLLRMPGGRLQAFDIAWDSRPRVSGGQHWFVLPDPDSSDGAPGWTDRDHSWNFACAPCHSTGVRKGYDARTDTYATTFDAVDVACAACHGSADRHLAWARGRLPAGDATFPRKGLTIDLHAGQAPSFGFTHPGQAIATRLRAGSGAAPNLCFGCHARREALVEAASPDTDFLDAYRPALLESGLYDDAGRNQGEVFEYGAFMQSRMARAGVSCVNCHDAHSLKLKAAGNALCAQCHAPDKFDTVAHTHLAAGQTGQCITCHMPQRIYMGIHVRHDHGFRKPVDPAFAAGFAAVRGGAPADIRLRATLGSDAPGIVRATAATLLADPASFDNIQALRRAASDADPLVRLGAARAAAKLSAEDKRAVALPLLADTSRAVRVEAARSLADRPPGAMPSALRHAIEDFLAMATLNADRPEMHIELGLFHAAQGDVNAARGDMSDALRINPGFVPALLDLADIDRQWNDESDAETLLLEATRIAPADPLALDALGLLRVRQGRRNDAVGLLIRAAARAPDNADAARLAAVAQTESGDKAAARLILTRALSRRPNDASLLATDAALAPDQTARDADAVRLRALQAADHP